MSAPEAVQEPTRLSLAVISSQNKPGRQQPNAAGDFVLSRPKRKTVSNSGKENAAGLDIFVDDAFNPGNPRVGPSSAALVPGSWTNLSGFEETRQVVVSMQCCFSAHACVCLLLQPIASFHCRQHSKSSLKRCCTVSC